MIVGIPKETKAEEYRVSLTPDKVELLVRDGHRVLVESHAGEGAGFPDDDFEAVGAVIEKRATEIFDASDMIVKVKEPQPHEYGYFHDDQILFTYLHLAPQPDLTQTLLDSKVAAIAYETVQRDDGGLPLLYPMSEIAGKLAPFVAARLLQNIAGGPGKLLGRVPGAKPSNIVIVGGGTVGFNAALVAQSVGADVTIVDIDLERLRYISLVTHGAIDTVVSTPANVADLLSTADVVVGAVLVPGGSAPKVVTRDMISVMHEGALIIDVAIDQGGSVEDIHPTSHKNPTYVEGGVTRYAVPNMPGIVGNTSSVSLSNATYPYVLALAGGGMEACIQKAGPLSRGVNTYRGHITHEAVSRALGLEYVPLREVSA